MAFRILAVAAVVMLSLAADSLAVIRPFVEEVPISQAAIASDPALGNFRTFDLKAQFEPGDRFSVAAFVLPLAQGTFYSPEFGGNLPVPAGLVALYPQLEFDTYVSAPAYTPNDSIWMPGRAFAPGPPRLPIFGQQQTELDVAWGRPNAPERDPGIYTIVRMTISHDAAGEFAGLILPPPIDPNPVVAATFSGTITSGAVSSFRVPEPSCAAIVCVFAACLQRRSRSLHR